MSEEHAKGGSHGGGQGAGGGHEEHHEGAPEWMISFADNVCLIMGFFVIMLAMQMAQKVAGAGSSGDAKGGAPSSAQALDTVIAIREGFNNPVDVHSNNPRDLPLIRRLLERAGSDRPPTDGPDGKAHDLQSLRPSDYFHLNGVVPFDDHSATMSQTARQTLEEIATHLRGLRVLVEVRGHASAAEAFQTTDRGMKLSFERAMDVAQALADAGLAWPQLRVISCGDSDRVTAPAYNNNAQRDNQRVEIVVTDQLMPGATPVPGSSPAATPATAGGAEEKGHASPSGKAGTASAHPPAAPKATDGDKARH